MEFYWTSELSRLQFGAFPPKNCRIFGLFEWFPSKFAIFPLCCLIFSLLLLQKLRAAAVIAAHSKRGYCLSGWGWILPLFGQLPFCPFYSPEVAVLSMSALRLPFSASPRLSFLSIGAFTPERKPLPRLRLNYPPPCEEKLLLEAAEPASQPIFRLLL